MIFVWHRYDEILSVRCWYHVTLVQHGIGMVALLRCAFCDAV